MAFQISALPASKFNHLFALSDEELALQKAVRLTVKKNQGTPCRVSLEDAHEGEEVILVNYQHQPANSPYQSSHAVYVRKDAQQAVPAPNEIPDLMRERLMSVRVFNKNGMLVDADVVEGKNLDEALESALQKRGADYVHLHYAQPGCFAASVTRT